MSKITLSPNASGAGIFTIASPNSNNNQTLTLPNATGTLVVSDSSGRILLPNQPKFQGDLSSYTTSTSNYAPTINQGLNIGFTRSGNSIVIPVAGSYMVNAQQLVSTTATSCYLCIRKNSVIERYAYSNSDDTYDVVVNTIVQCAAGDLIDAYYQGTTTYSWGGGHSGFNIFFLG